MNLHKALRASILLALVALLAVLTRPAPLRGQATTLTSIPERFITQIRELQGLAISPVPMNFEGRDPELVALGSYLVNSMGCVGCHTSPTFATGGDPYAGQPQKINATNFLAGGTAFGPFTSRNITPDESGKPAGLDFDEFERAIRRGEDVKKLHPQMGPLLQVMPWPDYRYWTEKDIRAVYEYLSAIPHADPVKK